MGELPGTVQALGIRLAMMSVPTPAAQEVVDQLVGAGVRGILNFAPVGVAIPPEVGMCTVDLAVQLEQLSFQVNFISTASPQPAVEQPVEAAPPTAHM